MKEMAQVALEALGWVLVFCVWLVTATFLVLGVVFLGAIAAKAEGSDYRDGRWVRQSIHQQHRRARPYRHPDSIRYYAAPRERYEEDERRSVCRDVRRAVGDQHLTVDGAKKAANDSWAGTIRFHHGEKYMDLSNARHIVYTCSRSSIKEAGSSVTTLGQAFTRCEIEATPCAPVSEREER